MATAGAVESEVTGTSGPVLEYVVNDDDAQAPDIDATTGIITFRTLPKRPVCVGRIGRYGDVMLYDTGVTVKVPKGYVLTLSANPITARLGLVPVSGDVVLGAGEHSIQFRFLHEDRNYAPSDPRTDLFTADLREVVTGVTIEERKEL